MSFKVKLTEQLAAVGHLGLGQICKLHRHHSLYRKGSTKKEEQFQSSALELKKQIGEEDILYYSIYIKFRTMTN